MCIRKRGNQSGFFVSSKRKRGSWGEDPFARSPCQGRRRTTGAVTKEKIFVSRVGGRGDRGEKEKLSERKKDRDQPVWMD